MKDFNTARIPYVNWETQLLPIDCIKGLLEYFTLDPLYSNIVVRGPTILFAMLNG